MKRLIVALSFCLLAPLAAWAVLVKCPACKATGKVVVTCTACGGAGYTHKALCKDCEGKGWAKCPRCGGAKGRSQKAQDIGSRANFVWVACPECSTTKFSNPKSPRYGLVRPGSIPCAVCNMQGFKVGAGYSPSYENITCAQCAGKGFQLTGQPCPRCGGAGQFNQQI